MSTTEDRNEDLKVYEVGYLVLPSIPEDKVSGVVDSMKKIISDKGATNLDSEAPFMRKLAYPISKVVGASKYVANEAYMGWMKFEAEAEQAVEIKSALDEVSELLRFLLIKAPRESDFTFAKAQAAIEEKAREEEEAKRAEEEAENDSSDSDDLDDDSDDENIDDNDSVVE